MGILSGAAYVQNRDLLEQQSDATLLAFQADDDSHLPGMSRRLWELLETPQTITSLARAVASEYHVDPSECTADIKASLTRLYREDLIQESPDT